MKTAIITGAARGIGRACAELLARNNYQILANYLTSEKQAIDLKDYLRKSGFSVDIKRADVSDYDQANSLMDYAYRTFGSIDILINNSGIALYSPINCTTPEQWDNIMKINVKSVYNCCNCVISYMLKQQGGKIINISSIWGLVGASCEVAYSASKAAVIGFTKALAKELAPSNINVNCIAPGVVKTDMISNLTSAEKDSLMSEIPLGKFADPMDIARSVLFLAGDASNYITGQILSPNGGFVI